MNYEFPKHKPPYSNAESAAFIRNAIVERKRGQNKAGFGLAPLVAEGMPDVRHHISTERLERWAAELEK